MNDRNKQYFHPVSKAGQRELAGGGGKPDGFVEATLAGGS
jgi:hypothetical protein